MNPLPICDRCEAEFHFHIDEETGRLICPLCFLEELTEQLQDEDKAHDKQTKASA